MTLPSPSYASCNASELVGIPQQSLDTSQLRVEVDDARHSGLSTHQLLCQTLHLLLENDILLLQMLCLPVLRILSQMLLSSICKGKQTSMLVSGNIPAETDVKVIAPCGTIST